VAPLLRSVDESSRYSNFHADIDGNGYFRDCQQYDWILSQAITGVFELPVVHCTYLIRADVIPALDYEDDSARHEYVIFSDRARRNGIPQYYDNRQLYGYLTLDTDHAVVEQAARLLADDLDAARVDGPASAPLIASEGQEDRALEEFSAIYRNNAWGYGSGVGSLPDNNAEYMELVQSFLEKERVQSVVDFGCGDWQFSRFMDWKGATYVGFDLVPDLIEANRKAFGRPGVSFEVFRSLDDIPAADLLLCKDVFQHLPNDTVREYLAAFKRKARFLLITNDDQPEDGMNSNIRAGQWRPVRLDYPPFAEHAPILLSWMITAGGWKPTRKTTCLITGHTD
jgi:SAM-dependent methyltransferase